MHEERRRDHMLDKLIRFWPVAAVIVAGATGYIRLQIAVSSVQDCPKEIKALENRIIILETQSAVAERWRARRDNR